MKKLFAVLVALALVLSMGVMAFAAETGTITIYNTVKDEKYTVYKMFDFVPVAGSTNQGRYTVVEEWKAFLANEGAAYLKENAETGTIEWVGEDTAERKGELAKLAVAYAKKTAGVVSETKTSAGGNLVFDNLDLGYYAVDTTLGALCALSNTNNTADVTEKNSGGTIIKEVKENSTQTWGETNDANIGETVEYRAKITAGKGTANYVMHDTMSAGLTFDAASVVVTVGDKTLVAGTDKDYVVNTTCGDGCTFEVDFTDAFEATLNENDVILVTYSAVLNENAVIAGAGNPNEIYLTYGNAQETTKDTVVTYTYQFQLVKTDDNDTLLSGAEFELYDAAEDGNNIPVVKESEGVYRVAKEGETGVVIEAGYVTIKGLDTGVYYLEETKAPDGYNELSARKTVEITGANNDATVTEGIYQSGGVQVVNKTGALLPETGGIGTTIFYVVGGLMMVAAVVFLVSKKRMASFA